MDFTVKEPCYESEVEIPEIIIPEELGLPTTEGRIGAKFTRKRRFPSPVDIIEEVSYNAIGLACTDCTHFM